MMAMRVFQDVGCDVPKSIDSRMQARLSTVRDDTSGHGTLHNHGQRSMDTDGSMEGWSGVGRREYKGVQRKHALTRRAQPRKGILERDIEP